jgi:hypothetical protein
MAQENSAGALAGTRVIDLSRVLGGPFCSQFLGDHGADVIKIEPPQGDETRGWGPPFVKDTASYFIGVNRNKRGVALDLSKPEGRAVLFRLLETADVLLENFKTGTLERWGMGDSATPRSTASSDPASSQRRFRRQRKINWSRLARRLLERRYRAGRRQDQFPCPASGNAARVLRHLGVRHAALRRHRPAGTRQQCRLRHLL